MKFIVALLFTCVAVVAFTPSQAEAKGLLIYNTGEKTFECGPIPAPFDKEPALAGYKAGYICNVKGIFWSYFSVSGCRPAAVLGNSYNDDPELAAAIKAKYPESSMQRGIWGKYGWMLLAAIILGGIVMAIKSKFSGDDE
jgi:hypothetical protein